MPRNKEKGLTPKLTEVMEEIEELKRARELLDKIWQELGPYGRGKIESTTLIGLQYYFGFDDGE